MQSKDTIAEDCRKYGRLNLIVERYKKAGKPVPDFVSGALEIVAKKMEVLWTETGLNMITACDLQLTEYLISPAIGYTNIAFIPERNICALKRMPFTVGLFYNIDRIGSAGRYCYHSWAEAIEAYNSWDGDGHPPGNWIKHYSITGVETNANYNKDSSYLS